MVSKVKLDITMRRGGGCQYEKERRFMPGKVLSFLVALEIFDQIFNDSELL